MHICITCVDLTQPIPWLFQVVKNHISYLSLFLQRLFNNMKNWLTKVIDIKCISQLAEDLVVFQKRG